MIPKPAIINFPTDDIEQGVRFFGGLLGVQPARALSPDVTYYAPVSSDGILLTVSQSRFEGETPTVFFAVDDLDGTIEKVQQDGGTLVAGPFDLPIPADSLPQFQEDFRNSAFSQGAEAGDSLGRGATFQDPSGNRFGLLQIAEWAHATFRLGQYANPVTDDQLADHAVSLRRAVGSVAENAAE